MVLPLGAVVLLGQPWHTGRFAMQKAAPFSGSDNAGIIRRGLPAWHLQLVKKGLSEFLNPLTQCFAWKITQRSY
ncbi:MAG: hypothetical protein SV775_15715, partial [Thermodesulfobacteriota bacterium]|nr:hypothetical protein [Thermodesulfobacteriota bacterium]